MSKSKSKPKAPPKGETFAERLQRVRTDRAMTLEQLAVASGVSRPYCWELEHGRRSIPSADILCKLARALDLSMDELWSGVPARPHGRRPAQDRLSQIEGRLSGIESSVRRIAKTKTNPGEP